MDDEVLSYVTISTKRGLNSQVEQWNRNLEMDGQKVFIPMILISV